MDIISQTGANDMSTAVMWSKSKLDVEFQYGGRLAEFIGIIIIIIKNECHSNIIVDRLQGGMSSEPPATLQGAATGRIQWHVIPEPRITLQGAATW